MNTRITIHPKSEFEMPDCCANCSLATWGESDMCALILEKVDLWAKTKDKKCPLEVLEVLDEN